MWNTDSAASPFDEVEVKVFKTVRGIKDLSGLLENVMGLNTANSGPRKIWTVKTRLGLVYFPTIDESSSAKNKFLA